MAIKVNGCTIIDDSRNIVNAASFTFNDGTCQTTASKNPYVTGIACSTISAGDPVSLICGCKGLATTIGCITPTAMLYAPCSCVTSETALLKFTDSCFASIQITAPCSYSSCACTCIGCNCCTMCTYSGCVTGTICVRSHKLSSTGAISSACIYCTSYSGTCIPSKSWSIPGCSGTTGAIVTPIGQCCLMETFFCYCSTTQQISMLRQCCACIASPVRQSFVTPDGLYFVSFVVCSPWTDSYGAVGCQAGYPCACWCVGAVVKQTTDDACYLNFTLATSCTVTLNSLLPATCATWHAGSAYLHSYNCMCCCCQGGWYNYFNGTSWVQCYQAQYGCTCTCGTNCGNSPFAASRGFTPFSYGSDGWILMNYYVCALSATAGATIGQCAGGVCVCWIDKYFAFKPIGTNCYALTCNSIIPDITCASNTLPFYSNGCCRSANVNISADFSCMYDVGDGIKRQLITSASADRVCYNFTYPTGGHCYSGVSYACTLGTCFVGTASTPLIQCFSIGAGPCISFICSSTTSANMSFNNYYHTAAMTPYNGGEYTDVCILPYGSSYMPVTLGSSCDHGCGVTPFTAKSSSFMYALQRAAIPVCYQCGCYHFVADLNEVLGCNCTFAASAVGNTRSSLTSGQYCDCYCYICSTTCAPGTTYTAVTAKFCTGGLCVTCCYKQLDVGSQNVYNSVPNLIFNGGYSPNSFLSCCNNLIVSFSNLSNYNNCPSLWGKEVLGVTSTVPTSAVTATLGKWIGIAQNSATAGQTVCYAVPGMLDRSPFATSVASMCPCGATIGWHPGNGLVQMIGGVSFCCGDCYSCACGICPGSVYIGAYYCNCQCYCGIVTACVPAGCTCACGCFPGACVVWCGVSSAKPCPANTTLLNGITCDSNTSFQYYNDNIRFVPIYDSATSQWTNQILTHCKNVYGADCNCAASMYLG